MGSRWMVGTAAILVTALGSGCDGRILVAGNLFVAAIPCVLLWVTLNLRRPR